MQYISNHFHLFILFVHISFTTEEEENRFQIFCQNMEHAKKIQAMEEKPSSARYGVTQFADMTEMEFRKTYLTPVWKTNQRGFLRPAPPANPNNDPIPDSFDWRDHNAVTPVKNQVDGLCNHCAREY